jgi:hypothetical protein
MSAKISLQQFADELVAPEYRQPLKTLAEALAAVCWDEVDRPTCCGAEVEINSFLGAPYFAQCKTCRRFIVDVTGPQFGNSWVTLPDEKKIDGLDTESRWIAGWQAAAFDAPLGSACP